MINERFTNLDERIRKLIENMLTFAPEKRFSIEDCLASTLFDEIRDKDLEKGNENIVECPNNFEKPKDAAKFLIQEIKLLSSEKES